MFGLTFLHLNRLLVVRSSIWHCSPCNSKLNNGLLKWVNIYWRSITTCIGFWYWFSKLQTWWCWDLFVNGVLLCHWPLPQGDISWQVNGSNFHWQSTVCSTDYVKVIDKTKIMKGLIVIVIVIVYLFVILAWISNWFSYTASCGLQQGLMLLLSLWYNTHLCSNTNGSLL